MTILELREKRAKAWAAAKAFLDSRRNDKFFMHDGTVALLRKLKDSNGA